MALPGWLVLWRCGGPAWGGCKGSEAGVGSEEEALLKRQGEGGVAGVVEM